MIILIIPFLLLIIVAITIRSFDCASIFVKESSTKLINRIVYNKNAPSQLDWIVKSKPENKYLTERDEIFDLLSNKDGLNQNTRERLRLLIGKSDIRKDLKAIIESCDDSFVVSVLKTTLKRTIKL